jgi:RHS repeat-associated protein
MGSMLRLEHRNEPSGFTREFTVESASNRLRALQIGDNTYGYGFDVNGNMRSETTARHFEWNHADQMKAFRTQTEGAEPSVHAHYLYDATGQRVKKLVRRQGGQIEVTHYIDEVFEHHRWGGGAQAGENNHTHVMDNVQRIALVRLGVAHPEDKGPAVQFQLGDHLGSRNVIVDSDSVLTNREEFTPYGETSFGSFPKKRYRFTGIERDEESGFAYHGARYYGSWFAKWLSADPIGLGGGVNIFSYCSGNPVVRLDCSGRNDEYCFSPGCGEWDPGGYIKNAIFGFGEGAATEGKETAQAIMDLDKRLPELFVTAVTDPKAVSDFLNNFGDNISNAIRNGVKGAAEDYVTYLDAQMRGDIKTEMRIVGKYSTKFAINAALTAATDGIFEAVEDGGSIVVAAARFEGKAATLAEEGTTRAAAAASAASKDAIDIILRKLGIAAEDFEQLAKGRLVWGTVARGQAEMMSHFEYEGGKLTAGVTLALNPKSGDPFDFVKAFLGFRDQSTNLAKQLGAKVIRFEGDVVRHPGIQKILGKSGFKLIPDRAGSWGLEKPVE